MRGATTATVIAAVRPAIAPMVAAVAASPAASALSVRIRSEGSNRPRQDFARREPRRAHPRNRARSAPRVAAAAGLARPDLAARHPRCCARIVGCGKPRQQPRATPLSHRAAPRGSCTERESSASASFEPRIGCGLGPALYDSAWSGWLCSNLALGSIRDRDTSCRIRGGCSPRALLRAGLADDRRLH